MERVYRLLSWLRIEDAAHWLSSLTNTTISQGDLRRLTLSGQCAVYIQTLGLKGTSVGDDFLEKEVIGLGFQRVVGSATLREADEENGVTERRRLSLDGEWYEPDPSDCDAALRHGCGYWEVVTERKKGFAMMFKPADIQALAAKILEMPELPKMHDFAALRLQLEQERTAREAAEAELLTHRIEAGKKNLDDMRHMLMHDHKEFSEMQRRAEQAEMMAAALDKQLTEQAEQKQLNERAFKEMARQLRNLHDRQPSAPAQDTPAESVIFPYATKELEAMRAAVAKYWEGYTSEKRQPTQVEIQMELCKLLGLGLAGGEAPRKVKALASAIKPDTLPDA